MFDRIRELFERWQASKERRRAAATVAPNKEASALESLVELVRDAAWMGVHAARFGPITAIVIWAPFFLTGWMFAIFAIQNDAALFGAIWWAMLTLAPTIGVLRYVFGAVRTEVYTIHPNGVTVWRQRLREWIEMDPEYWGEINRDLAPVVWVDRFNTKPDPETHKAVLGIISTGGTSGSAQLYEKFNPWEMRQWAENQRPRFSTSKALSVTATAVLAGFLWFLAIAA